MKTMKEIEPMADEPQVTHSIEPMKVRRYGVQYGGMLIFSDDYFFLLEFMRDMMQAEYGDFNHGYGSSWSIERPDGFWAAVLVKDGYKAYDLDGGEIPARRHF